MRILYTIVAFCLVSFAWAQEITEKDLLGTWEVTRASIGEMAFDYEKLEVELSPEMEAMMPPESKEEMKKGMVETWKSRMPEVTFVQGFKMISIVEGERDEQAYTLRYSDGKNTLQSGTSPDFTITLDAGILHLNSGKANDIQVDMWFRKLNK